jgi:hypothetical protein
MKNKEEEMKNLTTNYINLCIDSISTDDVGLCTDVHFQFKDQILYQMVQLEIILSFTIFR